MTHAGRVGFTSRRREFSPLSRKIAIFVVATYFFGIASHFASAEEIRESQHSRSSVVGGAYDSNKEAFVGSQCVTGEVVETGASEGSLSLSQALSEESASRELGFSAGARGRYGLYEGSVSAEFMNRSTSSALSVSSIYSAVYLFPKRKLAVPKVNDIGAALGNNFERWEQTCGTHYVDEVRTGARFYFSIRIDFASQSEKQQFQGSFSISGPAFGINATLKEASEHFSRNSTVTVSVYQDGGDVGKVSGIFANSDDGRKSFVQCSIGNFEDCAVVLQNALRYATDTQQGFPAQLAVAGNQAVLSYDIAPYAAAGLYKGPPPFLREIVALKRRKLAEYFEQQYGWRLTADTILRTNPPQLREQKIKDIASALDRNLASIVKASTICYDSPDDCEATVDSLALELVDASAFQAPNFSQLCLDAYLVKSDSRATVAAIMTEEQGDKGTDLYSVARPYGCCDRHAKDFTACKVTPGVDADGTHFEAVETPVHELGSGPTDLSRKYLSEKYNYNHPLTDLTALQSGAENKRELDFSGQSVTKIDVLALMTNLERLRFDGNTVQDIRPLGMLRELRYLSASNNEIADLQPLAGLNNLSDVSLSHNLISSVAGLEKAPRLAKLDLSFNDIKDLSPLSALTNLEELKARHNRIDSLANFSPPNLKRLYIEENRLDESEIEKFCTNNYAGTEILYTDNNGKTAIAGCSQPNKVTLTKDEAITTQGWMTNDQSLMQLIASQAGLDDLAQMLKSDISGSVDLSLRWNQQALSSWRQENAAVVLKGKEQSCREISLQISRRSNAQNFFAQLYEARGCRE